MRSKSLEALKNIKKAPAFMGGNPKYSCHTQSSEPFLKDIGIIEKDLIILEMLTQEYVTPSQIRCATPSDINDYIHNYTIDKQISDREKIAAFDTLVKLLDLNVETTPDNDLRGWILKYDCWYWATDEDGERYQQVLQKEVDLSADEYYNLKVLSNRVPMKVEK